MRRVWTIVAIVAGVFLLTDRILQRDHGLTRTATVRAGQDVIASARVDGVDLRGVDRLPGYPAGITLSWTGAWKVPSTGLYDLELDSRGRSTWRIDGQLANEVPAADRALRTVWLTAGFHQIEISYEPDPAAPKAVVAAAKTGHTPAPLAVRALKPQLPRNPRLRAAGEQLRVVLFSLFIVMLIVAIRRTTPAVRDWWRRRFGGVMRGWPAAGKAIAWTALAVIVSYGALLRIDAIAGAYGPVTSPAWLAAIQTRTIFAPERIRPAEVVWQPAPLFPHADGQPTRYASDPYVYLESGREMQSFYAAHFREPVFPFATRVFLGLLNNQDVAVSFTSTAFAMLAIWLTYVLGAAVWSRPVGLVAALGFALDVEDISLASAGWRDDAFVATVALSAYVILRCWRAASKPAQVVRLGRVSVDVAYIEALILGVVGGLAILVRFMAISFIIPGAALLLLAWPASVRRRLTMAGIVVVTAVIVAGPYFVNCWRVYGDPLYTFNVHGNIYRVAEGKGESDQGTAAYIINKFATSPVEMVDTIARGLSTYPFGNKWQGLERWVPGIALWAKVASAVGLILLAASATGRVVLFVMVMSLVPFSFTWTVDPNWRFTAHVYPFLLIAAAIAVSATVRAIYIMLVPGSRRAPSGARMTRTAWIVWATAGVIGLVSAWAISTALPRMLFVENLRLRGVATVTAGVRDSAFFGTGWSAVAGSGNVRMRIATTARELVLPLPAADDYDVTLRLDPFPRPLSESVDRLPRLEVSWNGKAISTIPLRWSADRVGVYEVRLPRALTQRGANRLGLRLQDDRSPGEPAHPGLSDGGAFGLWYVRVQSGAAKKPA